MFNNRGQRKIMEVIPAVDIKGGKCVRLYQGDYKQETIFSEDPVEVAMKWVSLGATRLHIVDLDGAASGQPDNIAIVERITMKVSVPIQLGGGIRDEATVEKLLGIGVKRVILGTIAIEKPGLIQELCRRYGDAIIIGIDARDGYVATRGWLQETKVKAIDLARQMAGIGVKRILYTDIKRDGTLTEPAFDAISELVTKVHLPVIAAGGVSAISHIRKLKDQGAEGAIVGKAIYTGNIDLKEALAIQKEK
jgi:phosphoribosylformimino-5-aminoimidazole carboxamide ribotide isomerase